MTFNPPIGVSDFKKLREEGLTYVDKTRPLLDLIDRPGLEVVLFHGFVVGLLATLEPEHRVRSNRESGDGRPDVLVIPQQAGGAGVVLELKVARKGRSVEEGLQQIAARDYTTELRAVGASPISAFAVAFDGREVRVARPR